ncbi:MAG: ABC transporter substrate-binding protein [Chloroflexi bacterium]|nr:ABC transporter substrate-binding protein [Chloroflexota bacterium]
MTSLILALPACSGATEWKGAIKLGLVAPFYGFDSSTAYNTYFAVKLAINEWNDRGGAGGHMIELVAMDDQADADVAAYQAKKMAADPDVVGVVGYLSSDTALKAAAVHREAGLAALTLGATAAAVATSGYPEVLRMSPQDAAISARALRILKTKSDYRRLAVVDDGSPGHSALAGSFAAEAARHDVAVVQQETVSPSQRDLAALVRRLETSRAQVVFFAGGYHQAAALAAALLATKPRLDLLLSYDSDTPDFVKVGGPSAVGVMYQGLGQRLPPDRPETGTFLAKYTALSGTVPGAYAVAAYDAANLLLEATRRVSNTSAKPWRNRIAAELRRVGAYPGLKGTFDFDENGARLDVVGSLYRLESVAYPGVVLE